MTADLETELRAALDRRATALPALPCPAAGVVAGARRRRRRSRLGSAAGGLGAAALLAAALGSGGIPSPSPTPGPGVAASSSAPRFSLVTSRVGADRALTRVGRYELTWLPDGIEPAGPVQTQAVRSDAATGRSGTQQYQHLTEGGVPYGSNLKGERTVTVINATGLVRDRADLDAFMTEPGTVGQSEGQNIEQGTVDGAPAYLAVRPDAVEIVFVRDEGTGLLVGVKTHGLDRTEATRIVQGLRLVKG